MANVSSSLNRKGAREVNVIPVIDALGILFLVAAFLLALVAPAHAATEHPFEGPFCEPTGVGTPPCDPEFGTAEGMAVDQSTGDLLVIDAEDNTLSRWHEDGTPSEFSALGSNVIDGLPGGPDETKSGEILGAFNGPAEVQVAIDDSGTASDGNIYVTNYFNSEIDIFASDGEYIGGLSESSGGAFGQPCGVAVDEDGNVYVGDYENGIYEFANPPVNGASDLTIPATEPCAVAAGGGSVFAATFFGEVTKFNAVSGEEEYVVSPGENTTVSVDPASGHVFVASQNNLLEYHAAATKASGAIEATLVSSTELESTATGVAVNGAIGNVYAASEGSENVEVYGPPAYGTTNFNFKVAKNGTGTGSVECEVAGGSAEPCPETATQYPEGTEIVLTATEGAHSVFGGFSGGGCSTSPCTLTLAANTTVTATFNQLPPSVENDPPGTVTSTNAVLNGHVDNEGDPAGSACFFEVALATDPDFSSPAKTPPCDPTPVTGSTNTAVTATATGLNPATGYIYRVVATNTGGTGEAESPEPFTTLSGPPLISEERAASVTATTATLNADVNPSGLATTYHFEWGTQGTPPYEHRVPAEGELSAGSGNMPAPVSTDLTGLDSNTTYHFRVVATNSAGETKGMDHQFTTYEERQALNSAGLPDSRRFELVSPADKRPQGAVRRQLSTYAIFQAADDGQSVLFPLLGGVEGTDSGGDATYLAKRSETGWQSTKVSPPSLLPSPRTGLVGAASAGVVNHYSSDLSCGIVQTFNPLTDDTPAADVELGIPNLYVRHDDGTYTLITDTVPSNPEDVQEGNLPYEATVGGTSNDCSRIYFQTKYRYLSAPSGVYEWREGTLRDAALLPDGAAPSQPIGFGDEIGSNKGTRFNSVSRDGSRLFFSTTSKYPATEGKQAVFLHEDGSPTVEVSRRQGGPRDSLGARYEVASPDGSHVFFLGTYGLAPVSSNGPAESCSGLGVPVLAACDLYDYDVGTGQLTDLSADANPADTKGSVVQGVLGVSDDGTSVYFAARGQLVPGKGKTYSENISGSGSANVYLAREGELSYVATVAADAGTKTLRTLLVRSAFWTSDVTPDGQHLLFETKTNITGYDSGGVNEAYLYSAADGTLTCVSCRPDGLPSIGTQAVVTVPLIQSFRRVSELSPVRQYKMSDDGNRIFFTMPDVLAAGAVSGNQNIYEWERGQVYLLLTAAPDTISEDGPGITPITLLHGASRSGDDVFIRTADQLTPYDTDFVLDLYDIRVDGGLPPPPTPPVPCDPAAGECQGTPPSPPGATSPASENFSGPGNPPIERHRCRKGKVRRHGKCLKKHKKHRRARHRPIAARGSDRASKSDSSRGAEAEVFRPINRKGAK